MTDPVTSRCCSTGSSRWSPRRSSDPSSVLVDATLGLGGHTEAILTRCPQAHVVGLDRDPQALELSRRAAGAVRRARHRSCTRCTTRSREVLADLGLDAGARRAVRPRRLVACSSTTRERGFAYAQDAPLDMRMDDTDRADRRRGAQHLLGAGARPGSCAVRRGAVRPRGSPTRDRPRARAREPFDTVARLVELVRDAIPAPARRTGGNPAKRTFQALRIEVNDELGGPRRALPAAVDASPSAAGSSSMSYHSLEDRIAKRPSPRRPAADAPPDLPVVPEGHEPELRLLTRGAEQADEAEVADNPAGRVGAGARRRAGPRGGGMSDRQRPAASQRSRR